MYSEFRLCVECSEQTNNCIYSIREVYFDNNNNIVDWSNKPIQFEIDDETLPNKNGLTEMQILEQVVGRFRLDVNRLLNALSKPIIEIVDTTCGDGEQ